MLRQSDLRPAAAVGHVFLSASDVAAATARLEAVGLRAIMRRADFAIIEMRGGTHIVVREHLSDEPVEADFDLMYDDLDGARARFTAAGFEVSAFERGVVHRQFTAIAPEQFSVRVVSSHAGDRPV